MATKDNEARREAERRRLGARDPRCGLCGEDRTQCLEAHHVAGRTHDPTTVMLCRNCHRVMSDLQRDHPPRASGFDTWLERVGRFLLGLADLLGSVVEALKSFGVELIARAQNDPNGQVSS